MPLLSEQDLHLILASNSPRRRQLLALGGWQFNVQSTTIDESPYPGEEPHHYVLRMAETKARAAAMQESPSCLVIGSDTIVVDTPKDTGLLEILGKPAGDMDAAGMLRRLRGRTHQVYTAVAIYRLADGLLISDLCITDVTMRNYCDEEIQAYVSSGDPLDKAGAYAIQHPIFDPVERIAGCFANVVGLPLCILNRCLEKLGLKTPFAIPWERDHEVCAFCQRIIREGL